MEKSSTIEPNSNDIPLLNSNDIKLKEKDYVNDFDDNFEELFEDELIELKLDTLSENSGEGDITETLEETKNEIIIDNNSNNKRKHETIREASIKKVRNDNKIFMEEIEKRGLTKEWEDISFFLFGGFEERILVQNEIKRRNTIPDIYLKNYNICLKIRYNNGSKRNDIINSIDKILTLYIQEEQTKENDIKEMKGKAPRRLGKSIIYFNYVKNEIVQHKHAEFTLYVLELFYEKYIKDMFLWSKNEPESTEATQKIFNLENFFSRCLRLQKKKLEEKLKHPLDTLPRISKEELINEESKVSDEFVTTILDYSSEFLSSIPICDLISLHNQIYDTKFSIDTRILGGKSPLIEKIEIKLVEIYGKDRTYKEYSRQNSKNRRKFGNPKCIVANIQKLLDLKPK